MKITKTQNGTALTIALEGRLDTATAPDLEKALKEDLAQATELTFDLAALEYISSAGLRVLLYAKRNLNGRMVVLHPNEIVMEVFEVTGFVDFLNIEK